MNRIPIEHLLDDCGGRFSVLSGILGMALVGLWLVTTEVWRNHHVDKILNLFAISPGQDLDGAFRMVSRDSACRIAGRSSPHILQTTN